MIATEGNEAIYDLNGRQVPEGAQKKGIYIIKGKNKARK